MEDKIISVATENKKEAESKAEPQESQSVQQADKKMVDTVAVPQKDVYKRQVLTCVQ